MKKISNIVLSVIFCLFAIAADAVFIYRIPWIKNEYPKLPAAIFIVFGLIILSILSYMATLVLIKTFKE